MAEHGIVMGSFLVLSPTNQVPHLYSGKEIHPVFENCEHNLHKQSIACSPEINLMYLVVAMTHLAVCIGGARQGCKAE